MTYVRIKDRCGYNKGGPHKCLELATTNVQVKNKGVMPVIGLCKYHKDKLIEEVGRDNVDVTYIR